MNESLIKYLAGLLDADGSLSFAFRSNDNGSYYLGLRLSLASSKEVDRDNFVETLPIGIISYYQDGKYKNWVVSKRADLEMLLPRLIKHMVIKAKHWQFLLDTWRNLRSEQTLVSEEQRIKLTELSKQSRKNTGSIKPKNHPTWAWLAGYLDGDGWYTYKQQFNKHTGYTQWKMQMGAVAHVDDIIVLEWLQKHFGGFIYNHSSKNHQVKVWHRSIGKANRNFALNFLPNVVKHSRLKKHKIEAIINHHRQRLSVLAPKGEAIV